MKKQGEKKRVCIPTKDTANLKLRSSILYGKPNLNYALNIWSPSLLLEKELSFINENQS